MTPLPALLLAACSAVAPARDRILLGDIAPAFPDAAAAAPERLIGLAPAPGVVRRFPLAELRRIGVRLHLEGEPQREVCVTRPVSAPDPRRFLEAMRARLPEAAMELIDYSRWPVPEGELVFPLAGLHHGYWRGDMVYAGHLRFAVWARVEIRVKARRVVAIRDLPARQPVAASDLRLDVVNSPRAAEDYADAVAAVAGKMLRRAVPVGGAIRLGWLEDPPLVARGDTVKVEARSGAAVLQSQARALSGGSTGQTIPFLNPASGKIFRARIDGPGHALLESLP